MDRRVLVVSHDYVGSEMAGPGIRAFNIARELGATFAVTLATPNDADIELPRGVMAHIDPGDPRAVLELAMKHDAVVAQRLPIRTMLRLATTRVRVIYDLYDPILLELLAQSSSLGETEETSDVISYERLTQAVALATGNAFICAGERQRDLWLGWLASSGRLTAAQYRRDPSLRGLIDVVPFGIEDEPPRKGDPAIKGVLRGVPADARVLIWGGGVWNWLDASTVIRAVTTLGAKRPDIRLVFMGGNRPNPNVEASAAAAEAVRLASGLGVRDRLVVFNDGWVPYDRRGQWLLEADIGVSAHFDDVEARFAFRTRLLDYVWAGLPIVTTSGDELGDLVEKHSLGATVPPENVGAWVQALDRLLDDGEGHERAKARVATIRSQLTWPRVVSRLAALVEAPGEPLDLHGASRLAAAHEAVLRCRLSYRHRGPRGFAEHLGGRLVSRIGDARPGSTAR